MKYFGTDGIRGLANTDPLTPATITQIAAAVAYQFKHLDRHRLVVIGKDTRLSGYMIESALVAGFAASGLDVVLLGPVPTPAVAMLTRSLRADLGVMISASHNPYMDNGLKFFGPHGDKLSDLIEANIEEILSQSTPLPYANGDDLGRVRRLEDAQGRYVEFVKNTFPRGLRLDGLKIVIDCAHGAAYKVAPQVLWELGAEVISLGIQPNGRNINHDCGALHPSLLAKAVLEHQGDVGIALDGDADRVIMVDEKGQILDGDKLIGLIASSWHKKGLLRGEGVVTTVMSNLGLERFLEGQGLKLRRTSVGDRYVSSHMTTHGFNVGGEQSGHIILNDYNTTGDGIIAALQILAILQTQNQPLSLCANIFATVPQVLRNLQVANGGILNDERVQEMLQHYHTQLSGKGRLLVRKSGTEAGANGCLIRIMVESEDATLVENTLKTVIKELETHDARISHEAA
jgi:phosphoglucosamine mutase